MKIAAIGSDRCKVVMCIITTYETHIADRDCNIHSQSAHTHTYTNTRGDLSGYNYEWLLLASEFQSNLLIQLMQLHESSDVSRYTIDIYSIFRSEN